MGFLRSSRGRSWGAAGLGAAALLVCVVAFGAGTAPTVVTGESNSDHTELTITVHDDIEWKDLHFEPWDVPPQNPPRKLAPGPKDLDVKNASGQKVGEFKGSYNKKTGSNHYVKKSSSSGVLKAGTYKINLVWDNDGGPAADWMQMKVYVTTNGDAKAFGPPDILGGAGVVTNGNLIPGFLASIRGPSGNELPVPCTMGAPTILTTEISEIWGGYDYCVYTSLTEDEEGFDDWQMGLNNVTQPVPPGWGVQILGGTGTLNPMGQPMSPLQVLIPANPALAGQSLFLVFAMLDPLSGEPLVTTNVLRLNILP